MADTDLESLVERCNDLASDLGSAMFDITSECTGDQLAVAGAEIALRSAARSLLHIAKARGETE